MAVSAPGTGNRSPRWIAARGSLGLLVLLLLGPLARADEEGVYYSRQTTFRIPFQIDPGDRRVAQVILHVSEDLGRTWQQVTTASPSDRGFNFSARRDGWYYFTVQTQDQDRRLYPATLEGTAPGLRVFVDTLAPDVKLRPMVNLRRGEVGVEWDLRDEALDLNTLRLEYRTPGQFWQEKTVQRQAVGSLRWDSAAPGSVEVRLQVKDRAGNLGEATTRIRTDGGRMERVDDPPQPPPPGGGHRDDPATAQVRKMNSKKISLNYKIEDVGPSDVSVIEIWKTRDGRLWQKHPQDADKKPPFTIEVDGEGRYGFTLVAKSGVGLGERPPSPGDPPQIWIEVDLTKPEVSIRDIVVGRGIDTGNLTISWAASDKNLSRQPITIAYSTKQEGPWTPIQGGTNLENSGKFVWRMPGDVPFEFFVRVEATDEAGNVGQADTPQSVKVDLSLPKARVIGVEPIRQP